MTLVRLATDQPSGQLLFCANTWQMQISADREHQFRRIVNTDSGGS